MEPPHLKYHQADDGPSLEKLQCEGHLWLQHVSFNAIMDEKDARPLAQESRLAFKSNEAFPRDSGWLTWQSARFGRTELGTGANERSTRSTLGNIADAIPRRCVVRLRP